MVSERPGFLHASASASPGAAGDRRANAPATTESTPDQPLVDATRRPLDRLLRVAFGHDTQRRAGLVRTLTATAVYVLCLLAQWASVPFDHLRAPAAMWLTVFCLTGSFGFLIAIRCGLTSRFTDASLTLPQMVFAIVSVALAYHLNPAFRGVLPIIVALVLVFGAFTLPARRCTQLGRFAVIVFGATMAFGAWREPQVFEPITEIFYFSFSAVILLTLAELAGQLSQLRENEKLQRRTLRDVMERLKLLATEDVLTGLPNRRHIQDWMAHEIARMQRSHASLCIALIDLDRFKRINDTFGHAAGDDALRIFARESRTALRKGDVLARWGGEEFILVMPSTTMPEAMAAIDRIRTRLALPTSWADFPDSRVTFSAGLTMVSPSQTFEQALQWADFALYEAKAQGRNRTSAALSDEPIPMDRLQRTSVA